VKRSGTLEVNELDIEKIIKGILNIRKYREAGLCEDTVKVITQEQAAKYNTRKRIIQETRHKLHQVAALHLGDPDYDTAEAELRYAVQSGMEETIAVCLRIAEKHATTRERLSIVGEYYQRIFTITGRPRVLLDLACGLNPLFALSMGLSASTLYYAYDIQKRRVTFLNSYFELIGFRPLAKCQDVLVNLPQETGDVALLLQEAHRMEQRKRGATRVLLDHLRARHIVMSLPAQGLSRRNDLTQAHRNIFERILKGAEWRVQEFTIANELVYCIDKGPITSEVAPSGAP
jgi:16S rRNA (guanine(1405)-N(7))-methyltransferase